MPATLRLTPARYSAATRQPAHRHDELQITLVLRGCLEERVGEAVERASALSVVTKDPGVVHGNEFGRDGALTVRLEATGITLADLVEHPQRVRPWRWTHDASVAAPFLRIAGRGAAGEHRFAADDDDIVDLLAAISARAAPSRSAPARWLHDTLERARNGWQPGLTVGALARAAGVHPVYFARCVRRWYGVAAGDLLRRERLRHAARAIADGDRRISAVAHGAGYADESHLNRDFARAAGMPPGRYRRLTGALGRFADSSPAGRPPVHWGHDSTARTHRTHAGDR